MKCDEEDNSGVPLALRDDESRSAVNSIVLDYYRKFGKKRDLEQYFSLSTAQNDIRDPSSMFWSRMKAETESSDSGDRSDKKSDSSQELCRISIKFPAVDSCIPKEEDSKTKIESVSPPIIIEEISQESRQNSDDDPIKSDDNHSQKSYDVLLDTSINKLHSPSSSITSQRKLEWDSLADVGYANESDRKTSASSLSTLERLALKQQYSNNDTQQNSSLGVPASHSTPLDENEAKSKIKKGVGKKSTKIYSQKDVDFLEVNVPHSSNMNPSQSINVNLTKHISFNVEKDGKVIVDNVQKDVIVSPEKTSVETEIDPKLRVDKEIQTSLMKSRENVLSNIPENIQVQSQPQRIPIIISLNTLRNRVRRKKMRKARRKIKIKKRADKENIPVQEKSGEQLSEAESFEYMPGHIYNQNKMSANDRPSNAAGNKSSLESSAVLTTDSSKGSSHSFTKDLEKSIDLLRATLQGRCDDSALRKQLVKQLCQRLITSKYRDDESTTDFLSGLSFSSKKLGLGERNNTTTSTSDANNSTEKSKRPKKSILRTDKFNPGAIASTSQSVPNLPVASKSENVVTSNLAKNLTTSNTDSDISGKEKSSSDNMFARTSSEELYQKYLQALKKEEAYKRHLKDKEMFLKQKLVSSDSAFKVPVRVKPKPNNRLKDLINDLTRNNYNDGSGDASKLEGGPGSNTDFDRYLPNRNQRSHSVFTLSSGNSDGNNKKPNLKKRLQCDIKDLSAPGPSKDKHYCCCPHHSKNLKFGVTDSSVQVDIKNPCNEESCSARQKTLVHIATNKELKAEPYRDSPNGISEDPTGDIRYMCLCSHKVGQEVPDNFLIYKCSRLTNQGVQLGEPSSKSQVLITCNELTCDKKNLQNAPFTFIAPVNKSSQTNMLLKMSNQSPIETSSTCFNDKKICEDYNKMSTCDELSTRDAIREATRWIQTEISINPKISEPTLSDINIVSDTNCAKLVCEFSRLPSKASLTEVYSHQAQCSAKSASSGSCKSSGTLKDVNNEAQGDIHLDATEKSKTENTVSKEINFEHSDNFTIPIQGTNMTLMVNIGSERRVPVKKKNEVMLHQGVETVRVNAIEQATCLTEECSKGVQANKLAFGFETDRNNKVTETAKNLWTINTCAAIEDPKFGTYPQRSPVNERKPLQRANTDTAMVNEVQIIKCQCGCSHIEGTCKGKCGVNKLDVAEKLSYTGTRSNIDRVSAETYSGKLLRNLPNKQSENNSHGYGGSKGCCKEDYEQRKSTPREQGPLPETDKPLQVDVQPGGAKDINNYFRNTGTEINSVISSMQQCEQSIDKPRTTRNDYVDVLGQKFKDKPCVTQAVGKQISTQNITTTPNEVWSCGSDGIKENCNKDCLENKKLSLDYTQDSDESIQNSQSECPCGCGGMKDSCKRDCIELNSTPRESNKKHPTEKKESCKTQPIDKEQSTQKEFSDEQKCRCGCGGLKGKCKKSCKGFKISPRKQNKKQSIVVGLVGDNKKLNTSEETSDFQKEKCFCGCGGIKENCKNDCSKIPCAKQIDKKEVGTQKDQGDSPRNFRETDEEPECVTRSTETHNTPKSGSLNKVMKKVNSRAEQTDVRSSDNDQKSTTETEQTDTDPILNMIQNITKKYSKKEIEKNKRKKCVKEIITVLNYLLETDDTGLKEGSKITCESTTTSDETDDSIKKVSEKTNTASAKNVLDKSSTTCTKNITVNTCSEKVLKKLVDKGIQLSSQKTKSQPCTTESSDLAASTDIPGTSSDSATCKVLNKIKKECERYHQKRCKIHNGKKCDGTSSTSMNCNQCNRIHHCTCRSHKCKGHKKMNEKMQKGSVAYNLILQTSESMVSESPREKTRLLKNIIVKVPKKKLTDNAPFREIHCTATGTRSCRSRSMPNESEISSMEEIIRKSQGATVREYLEKNRPDFIDRSSQRQSCLKYISESRASERAIKRDLLSLHVAQLPDVTELTTEDLRRLAKDLGRHMRQKQPVPKLISEREMKKHSEKIYKSLPEVVQKKEEKRKETIKKTNLLMANMFKRNLQKKTLCGSVNLSNYSTVIKI